MFKKKQVYYKKLVYYIKLIVIFFHKQKTNTQICNVFQYGLPH